jgi:hypothetical protein
MGKLPQASFGGEEIIKENFTSQEIWKYTLSFLL